MPCPTHPDEADARRLFAALGLDSRFAVLRNPQDPLPAGIGFPVALKILSPDLAHKTEVGGVELGHRQCRCAARGGRRHAGARRGGWRRRRELTGFLVQPMAKGLGEAILGFRRDPEVGPVVLLGAGGMRRRCSATSRCASPR